LKAGATGQLVDTPEPDVVSIARVLRSRVAEPDDQKARFVRPDVGLRRAVVFLGALLCKSTEEEPHAQEGIVRAGVPRRSRETIAGSLATT
jgi:hypothetical protein